MIFRRLSEVAPPKASRNKAAPTDVVWHLTLDQIDSGLGQVDRRVYGLASAAGSSSFAFDTGNVLYSKLRPYLNKVICPDADGIATSELVPLRPNPTELNREYLCFYLRSPEFLSWASTQVDGAKMPRMKMSSFWAHEIPVPPLNDQIRIAHLLGKIETIIAQRKQHLQQLDVFLKSLFFEMFGDPISNPYGFPVKRLSDFYVSPKEGTKCGPFGSALKKEELVEKGVPVWNMDNIDADGDMVLPFRMWITIEKYRELSAYAVQDGDIIISRAGTVGKMCVAYMNGQPAIISTNLIRLRLGADLRPLHFVSLMLYCKGRVGRLKTGADGAFTHMNTGVLDSLEFPYPSLDLQMRYGEIANKVRVVKSRYQESLTELENLYAALSQKAFKGELNLSRVPLLDTQSGETNAVATEHSRILSGRGIAINLPNPENLLDALENAGARKILISNWLEAYLSQLGSTSFSVPHFMETAQNQLAELHPDIDFELGANDYEHIKTWVFEALASHTITQTLDDVKNQIQLKGAQA